ncbi:ABC transporter permease [Prauserella cavernicola]|uniref:ABC transporter permease n=1 Tax=Prauserella cavernicola TaxID=2800127 RepID=A0A934V6Z1_9PSEU|nr:ABC transporter permease [Prauserella cavernicola]MBK1787179.1 ABC transporter permease [Prauserella cavernicola]
MISLYWNFRVRLAWGLVLLAVVAFAVMAPGFLSVSNVHALVQSFAALGVLAVGLSLTMIAGEFDLSIAGVVPLTALITIAVGQSTSLVVGVVLGLLVALAFGLLNGWLTARFSIPALAVTVGTMVLTTGLGHAVAGGEVVTLTDFGIGLSLDAPVAGILSIHSIVELGLVVAAVFVMARTWTGLTIYSVGSDPARSAASGLSVSRAMVTVFVASALFAGVAGALQGISLAAATPGADLDTVLQAATAVIVGGVALSGGKGKVLGAIAGAALLSVVGNGLSLIGTPTAVVQLANAAILLVVVVTDGTLTRLVRRGAENAATTLVPAPAATTPQGGSS